MECLEQVFLSIPSDHFGLFSPNVCCWRHNLHEFSQSKQNQCGWHYVRIAPVSSQFSTQKFGFHPGGFPPKRVFILLYSSFATLWSALRRLFHFIWRPLSAVVQQTFLRISRPTSLRRLLRNSPGFLPWSWASVPPHRLSIWKLAGWTNRWRAPFLPSSSSNSASLSPGGHRSGPDTHFIQLHCMHIHVFGTSHTPFFCLIYIFIFYSYFIFHFSLKAR